MEMQTKILVLVTAVLVAVCIREGSARESAYFVELPDIEGEMRWADDSLDLDCTHQTATPGNSGNESVYVFDLLGLTSELLPDFERHLMELADLYAASNCTTSPAQLSPALLLESVVSSDTSGKDVTIYNNHFSRKVPSKTVHGVFRPIPEHILRRAGLPIVGLVWDVLHTYDCEPKRWTSTTTMYNNSSRCCVSVTTEPQPLSQCSIQKGPLTHKCHTDSVCREKLSDFSLGNYECVCKSCQNTNASGCASLDGVLAEQYHSDYLLRDSSADGRDGVERLEAYRRVCDAPEYVEESHWALANRKLKFAILSVQGLSMMITGVFILLILVIKSRKKMEASKWVLLEIILFGGVLLYATVAVEYLEPSTLTCLLHPWIREMGFVCTYGALLLKTYKTMAEFKTRKARRVHIRDVDLLKYWFWTAVVVVFYVLGWTALNLDLVRKEGVSLVVMEESRGGDRFLVCLVTGWDLLTEVGELMFLLFGLYMAYSIRGAPSVLWECKFILVVLVVEALVSVPYTICRYLFLFRLHPDVVHVISFVKVQITVTLTLTLTVGAKLWFLYNPPKPGSFWSEFHFRQQRGQLRAHPRAFNGSFTSNMLEDGEPECPGIEDLNSEELRVELRRVYAQLQLLRKDVMTYQNPHIVQGRRRNHSKYKRQLLRQISKGTFYERSLSMNGAMSGAESSTGGGLDLEQEGSALLPSAASVPSAAPSVPSAAVALPSAAGDIVELSSPALDAAQGSRFEITVENVTSL